MTDLADDQVELWAALGLAIPRKIVYSHGVLLGKAS